MEETTLGKEEVILGTLEGGLRAWIVAIVLFVLVAPPSSLKGL